MSITIEQADNVVLLCILNVDDLHHQYVCLQFTWVHKGVIVSSVCGSKTCLLAVSVLLSKCLLAVSIALTRHVCLQYLLRHQDVFACSFYGSIKTCSLAVSIAPSRCVCLQFLWLHQDVFACSFYGSIKTWLTACTRRTKLI